MSANAIFALPRNHILTKFLPKKPSKMKFTAAATALFLASASAFAPRNAVVNKVAAPSSSAMNA